MVNLGAATNLFFNSRPTINCTRASSAGTQSTLFGGQRLQGATNNVSANATNYISSNTNVVTVSAAGLLKPGTNGTAQVVACWSRDSRPPTSVTGVIAPTSLSISVANTNLLSGNGQGDTTTATLYANYSDAANVPVNSYQFVSFSSSANITVQSNGTLTAVGPGYFSVTGNYDGLSVTTNNAGLIIAWANPFNVPAMAVHFTGPNVTRM